MDSAVLNAQFEMAMSDELSRAQFYWRAQSVLRERDSLKAQIAGAQQQEPVLYQSRMRDISRKWGFWKECSQSFYEQSGGFSVSGTIYQHEFRKLYAAPVIPQIALPAPDMWLDALMARPEKLKNVPCELQSTLETSEVELTADEIIETWHDCGYACSDGHAIKFARAIISAMKDKK